MKKIIITVLFFVLAFGIAPAAQAFTRTGEVVVPTGDSGLSSDNKAIADELQRLRSELMEDSKKKVGAIPALGKKIADSLEANQNWAQQAGEAIGIAQKAVLQNEAAIKSFDGKLDAVHANTRGLGEQAHDNTRVVVSGIRYLGAIIVGGFLFTVVLMLILYRKSK